MPAEAKDLLFPIKHPIAATAKITPKPVKKALKWCADKYIAWGEWSEKTGFTRANNATAAVVGTGAAVATPAILGAKKL